MVATFGKCIEGGWNAVADETRQVAQFILDLREGEIPDVVRERLRYLILDNLASGYLGSRQSCYRISAKVVTALGGSGTSHVFGESVGLDISRASLLNGIAIGAFETDNTTFGAHAGGAVFPAVLALGESLGATGDAVMRALVVGYEVNARVAAAQTNLAEQVRGFHNPGISGPFAAAAGCAVLLGLSLPQTLAALGIAGSHSAGLIEYVWTGAMTKRIHEGRAAQMGLESALLAQQGFTGPPTVFEGEYGYLHAFSPEPAPGKLVEELGSKWILEDTRVKPYAGHGTAQPFVPVLDAWRARGLDPLSIESIHITTSEQGTEARFQHPSPDSVLGAQYSMPFMTAVALAGGIDGLIDLNEDVLDDDVVRQLASRVTISGDERFHGNVIAAGGQVELTIDGSPEVLAAPGIPKLDLDALRGLCRSKLERYSRGLVPADRIAKIEELVERFDDLPQVSQLTKLIFGH
jgi:2-methylcitrate dehydratase PrpD